MRVLVTDEERREYRKRYHREYQRKRRREDPVYAETRRQYQRDWVAAHPERQRQIARKHHAKVGAENRAFLRDVKQRSGCVDCGFWKYVDALQFDHVDPTTKLGEVASFATNTSKMMAELAKCVVRCANCHAIRTARQRRERSAA